MKLEILKLCLKHIHRNPLTINDQFVGTITINNGKCSHFSERRNNNSNNYDVIVFVLESPHVDEFLECNLHPLANDKYFWFNIDKAIKNSSLFTHLSNGKYALYFMNAIQYQCSLGFNTEYYRDLVFLFLWEMFKNDFGERLSNITKNNNVVAIVNLCTLGGHTKLFENNSQWISSVPKTFCKKFIKHLNKCGFNLNSSCSSLREIVEDYILNTIKPRSYYTTGKHPSCWYTKSNLIN